jgi:uncharacterized surface protein with fasciclin (FAS1) repeats
MIAMKKILLLVFVISGFHVNAQKYTNTDQAVVEKKWKEVTFTSEKTFLENIEAVGELSYISDLIKDEDFRTSLESNEMITIFAPLDRSLLNFPEHERDSILNYNNGSVMKSMFKYHIIPGRIDRHSIVKALEVNDGLVYFATLSGEKIGIKELNGNLVLFDSMNNSAIIRETDFYHSQGLFHLVEGMVFPANEQ